MGLTASQEKFCQNIADGMSQYEAMLDAYPQRKAWKRKTVDEKASILAKKDKIKERIERLKKPAQDILEEHREDLIRLAIQKAKGEKKDGDTTILSKLLDKLLPTKTENKNENRDKTIEDFLEELQK